MRSVEAHYLAALVKLGQRALPQQLATSVKACLAQSDGAHGGAWLLLASLLGQQGRRGEAAAALEGGLQTAAPAWRPHLWHALARLQAGGGNTDAALHSLSEAVAAATAPDDCAAVRRRRLPLHSTPQPSP